MKKIVYFNMLLLLLFLEGCKGRDSNVKVNHNKEVSDNIHILYNIDEVEQKEEASVYYVEYFQADADQLIKELLKYDKKEEESNAFGKSYLTDVPNGGTEVLIVFDGGEESGTYSGVDGGFTYAFFPVEKDYQNIVEVQPDHSSNVSQVYGYSLREDFSEWENLEFLNVDDALDVFKKVAENCNLPDIKIDTIYALDKETMQKHEEIRKNYEKEDSMSCLWTKDDEAYLLYFMQVIDDIPLVSHMWESGVRREATEVPIYGLIAGNGIFEFHIEKTVEVIEEIERGSVISPEEAESLLLGKLHQTLQISDIFIENLQLSYVNLYENNRMKIVPVWIFCIGKEVVSENFYAQETVYFKEYEHFVVNAITGEEIKKAVNDK